MTDPYPQYQLRTEKGAPDGYASIDGTGKIPTTQVPVLDHGALAGLADDDHPQYQKESERGQVNGYAPLDSIGVVPDVHLPPGLITDVELAVHESAADPHTGYQKETEKGAANGYASLDATGKVPLAQLPSGLGGGSSVLSSNEMSLADGELPSTAAALYTVGLGLKTAVKFISVKNNVGTNQSVELFIKRSGGTSRSIGVVLLGPGEYAWYLDTGEVISLSVGDSIEGISTNASSVAYIICGAEYA